MPIWVNLSRGHTESSLVLVAIIKRWVKRAAKVAVGRQQRAYWSGLLHRVVGGSHRVYFVSQG